MIFASILECVSIIFNTALPPKIPLWNLLCSVDEYAYTGGICMDEHTAFTGSETLSSLHLKTSWELHRLNCATYCSLSQTAPYAAFHTAKLIKLKNHPYSA